MGTLLQHNTFHTHITTKMAAFAATTPSLKVEFRGRTAGLKRGKAVKAAAVNTVTEAKIKVAINGFGRIGRNFLRCWHGRAETDMEVIAVNDTGAAKAVALVLPEMKGKLTGIALRVPTPNVSVVDLVVETEKPVTADQVNQAFRDAAAGDLKGVLAVSDE